MYFPPNIVQSYNRALAVDVQDYAATNDHAYHEARYRHYHHPHTIIAMIMIIICLIIIITITMIICTAQAQPKEHGSQSQLLVSRAFQPHQGLTIIIIMMITMILMPMLIN